MGKIVTLEFPKFQEKMFNRTKTAPLFLKKTKITTLKGHTDVWPAQPWHFSRCFFLSLFNCRFMAFLFLLSVALFQHFLSFECCCELAQIVLLISLNADPDIQVMKLNFRGASQNSLPFLLWREFFLETLQVS